MKSLITIYATAAIVALGGVLYINHEINVMVAHTPIYTPPVYPLNIPAQTSAFPITPGLNYLNSETQAIEGSAQIQPAAGSVVLNP